MAGGADGSGNVEMSAVGDHEREQGDLADEVEFLSGAEGEEGE
jgi:hypothetical protein